jgi:hypothetical protein
VKQRTWEAFTLLAGQVPQLMTPQAALIALDYSPFPQAMVQKLKAAAAGALTPPPAPPPPDPLAQAETTNLLASAELKGAQAQKVRMQTAVHASGTDLAQVR